MALKGFKAFTPDEVRFIKENMIRGVTVSALARHFGVSIETVSKIKRGVTYTDVVVEGEERLRPQSPLGERAPREGLAPPMIRARTVEEIDAEGLEKLAKVMADLGMKPDRTPLD